MSLDLGLLVARRPGRSARGPDRSARPSRWSRSWRGWSAGAVQPAELRDARRPTRASKPVSACQNSHSVSYAGSGTSRHTWSTTGGGGGADAGMGDQAEHEAARRRHDDVAELVPDASPMPPRASASSTAASRSSTCRSRCSFDGPRRIRCAFRWTSPVGRHERDELAVGPARRGHGVPGHAAPELHRCGRSPRARGPGRRSASACGHASGQSAPQAEHLAADPDDEPGRRRR